jgi:hypothetical protein
LTVQDKQKIVLSTKNSLLMWPLDLHGHMLYDITCVSYSW